MQRKLVRNPAICRHCGKKLEKDTHLCPGCLQMKQDYINAVNKAAGAGVAGMDYGMFHNRDMYQQDVDLALSKGATWPR